MLTKIIVNVYGSVINTIIEISLWLNMIGVLIFGWTFGDSFGSSLMWSIIFLAVWFFFAVLIYGTVLVLIDIRKIVKAIEGKNQMSI
jgi:hypothetical protein